MAHGPQCSSQVLIQPISVTLHILTSRKPNCGLFGLSTSNVCFAQGLRVELVQLKMVLLPHCRRMPLFLSDAFHMCAGLVQEAWRRFQPS